MSKNKHYPISRRNFIKVSAATTAGVTLLPLGGCKTEELPPPMTRKFGNLGFDVTTIALGGQASLQWTPDDVDPVPIILKAFEMGVNYYDTSNLYDGSQLNFGKAFRKLNLIPGEANYDEGLRKSIWLTSKTHHRWGNPDWPERENVSNRSNGENIRCAVEDVKRSLTQIFGDGEGYYPEGAYLDMVLCHNLNHFEEVDAMYEGLETPLDPKGNFGALVALRDLRDGTNHTGMNPKNEKLIRHIGFSGHNNPPAMLDMIQRDEFGILDGMLVSINANDKQNFNMQHNVIPVAEAKGMGVIGMKVFADAAMYGKDLRWSRTPEDVFRKVGTAELPSRPLIEYALTTPGVHTLIIGIGQIDDDPMNCQLVQNFYASQIEQGGLSDAERSEIEQHAAKVREGKTNYFQIPREEMSPPRDLQLVDKGESSKLTWQTAYSDQEPIDHYEVMINGEKVGQVEHKPQVLKSRPFVFEGEVKKGSEVVVAAVDAAGNRKEASLA